MDNGYKPKTITHPGISLKYLIKERGLTLHEFAVMTKLPIKIVQRLIKGKQDLTEDDIEKIAVCTGTAKEFWINRQEIYNMFKRGV